MGIKTDRHGLVFKPNEVKMYYNGEHTWAMKLSQLHRQKGKVRIITYSLPSIAYIIRLLGKRPRNIRIICHSKFKAEAIQIIKKYPLIKIAMCDEVHSKVCLIEPSTVYIGSANFGVSGWHETEIPVRSKTAHDDYIKKSFNKLWLNCTKLN